MKQPRREAGPRLVTAAIAIQAQEDVLGEVLGLLAVAELLVELAEDAPPVQREQFAEGARLVTADAQHQLHVRLPPPAVDPSLGDQVHGQPWVWVATVGMRTRKVLPRPSSLSTVIVPPN